MFIRKNAVKTHFVTEQTKINISLIKRAIIKKV